MRVPTVTTGGQIEMTSYPETWLMGFAWEELEPFTAEMQIVGIERGRSAARFVIMDTETEYRFPLFMSDILALITDHVLDHGKITGIWEPVKRGQNYAVRMVKLWLTYGTQYRQN